MKSITQPLLWLSFILWSDHASTQNFYNSWYYNENDLIWEAGGGPGIMNCLTDLGGKRTGRRGLLNQIRWSTSRPSVNLYAAATYKDLLAFRFNWIAGSINAADSLLKKEDPDLSGRYGRNLSFRSPIREFSLVAEVHPLFWRTGVLEQVPAFSPYLLAGIGYYLFNPQTLLGKRRIDLRPLHLEGQGFPLAAKGSVYHLRQLSIPAGFGIRYETGPLVNIRLECVYRFLFTDYLDDVSTVYIDPGYFDRYLEPEQATLAKQLYQRMDELQPGLEPATGTARGNPSKKDAYFSLQLVIGYVFRNRVK